MLQQLQLLQPLLLRNARAVNHNNLLFFLLVFPRIPNTTSSSSAALAVPSRRRRESVSRMDRLVYHAAVSICVNLESVFRGFACRVLSVEEDTAAVVHRRPSLFDPPTPPHSIVARLLRGSYRTGMMYKGGPGNGFSREGETFRECFLMLLITPFLIPPLFWDPASRDFS